VREANRRAAAHNARTLAAARGGGVVEPPPLAHANPNYVPQLAPPLLSHTEARLHQRARDAALRQRKVAAAVASKWAGLGWQKQAHVKRVIANTLRHRGVRTTAVALPAEPPEDGQEVNLEPPTDAEQRALFRLRALVKSTFGAFHPREVARKLGKAHTATVALRNRIRRCEKLREATAAAREELWSEHMAVRLPTLSAAISLVLSFPLPPSVCLAALHSPRVYLRVHASIDVCQPSVKSMHRTCALFERRVLTQ